MLSRAAGIVVMFGCVAAHLTWRRAVLRAAAHPWCHARRNASSLRLCCRAVVWIAIKGRSVRQSWSVVRQSSWRLVIVGSSWSTVAVRRSAAVVEVGYRRIVVEYIRSAVAVGKKLWL